MRKYLRCLLWFTTILLVSVFMMGCATTTTTTPVKSPFEKVTMEVGTFVDNLRMSYSLTVEDDVGLFKLQPNDVIYTTEFPKGLKVVVLWVTLTCPKDELLRIEWQRGGKTLYGYSTKMPNITPGIRWHFWLRHKTGLPAGFYTAIITLGTEKDHVNFIVK